MLLRSVHHPARRRGVILLVVLSMLTLFSVIGITFVYFAESQVTQVANQKEGETIKLPDADMLFNFAIRQIIYPTDNRSAFFTHSLMENLYGKTGNVPTNGTGKLPRFWRDNQAGVRDPHLLTNAAAPNPNPLMIGQDELYRLNKQFQNYDEQEHGSLNPTYTYPDHKNAFLGSVAANWMDNAGNFHGPVAVARSFAREIKLRIAIVDTNVTSATEANVVGYQEIIVNPFSNTDYAYWLPNGAMYLKPITLPILNNPFVYAPNSVIQCNPNGAAAMVRMDAQTCLAHTLRPNPRTNPLFPPPADLGGDVKNLPPEVKTLVGYTPAGAPIFADHDSYWMDFGFPAIPWSNNKKLKPLVAAFIKSNDGTINLNVHGNTRGQLNAINTFHVSGSGLTPGEINPMKVALAGGVPAATALAEHQQLIAGRVLPSGQAMRGRNGVAVPTMDPSTHAPGYYPLLRRAPFYSRYNSDGTYDGNSIDVNDQFDRSVPYLIPGQAKTVNVPAAGPGSIPDQPYTNYSRFPFYNAPADGFASGDVADWFRGASPRSPFFSTPFAPDQVTANIVSDDTASTQRIFGLFNYEVLYRGLDAGADHLSSDLRRLMPVSLSRPEMRWQYGLSSMDLNSVGVAPWFNGTGDALLNPYPNNAVQPPPNRDLAPGRVSFPSRTLPWTSPAELVPNSARNGEFIANMTGGVPNGQLPPYWRSIFGNTDRIDLARQLPDFPMPAGVDAHLDFNQPATRAQYFVALRARQRLALEIYNAAIAVVHPRGNAANHNARRYLAQLAVNIVDYIDNDDTSTWMVIPEASAPQQHLSNIVWGTELPRILLNEIYTEAITGSTSGGRADGPYHVRFWVELYNPLVNTPFADAWPGGAAARLNVNGTSVYRFILTRSDNVTPVPTAPQNQGLRNDPTNTLGMPIDMTNGGPRKVQIVYIPQANGANPVSVDVNPSGTNYGTGAVGSAGNPNPGFFVVGPRSAPVDVAPANFQYTNYSTLPATPEGHMQLNEAIPQGNTAFPNAPTHQPAVLLQRLANPHLPYNPVPPDPSKPDPTTPASQPNLPYNPYITIDYAENLLANNAVNNNTDGNANNKLPPDQRLSMGKIQPYAGAARTWTRQYPDSDGTSTTVRDEYTDRPQHTFQRHNAINHPLAQPAPPPNGAPDNTAQPGSFPMPDPGLTGAATVTSGLAVNTLRLPFDWLVHLDRAPVSPAELLHVSGYRPHELTQQFNQFATVRPVTVTPPAIAGRTLVTISLPLVPAPAPQPCFFGYLNGVPWAIKAGDMVQLTYATATGAITEWARVETINSGAAVNRPTSYPYTSFTAYVGQHGQTVAITGPVTLRAVVPFAHQAPWHLSGQAPGFGVPQGGTNVDIQSTNRLYRLLEFLAVRNPSVDIGQVRFVSNGANNIGPMDNTPANATYGTRWIQISGGTNLISPAQMPLLRPNDALLGMTTGDPLVPANPPVPVNNPTFTVGDTLVINPGQGNPNFPAPPPNGLFVEQRVTVLEVDWQNNRIRVALPYPPPDLVLNGGTSAPLSLDYAYHAGRQPGKINLNDLWDVGSFVGLADPTPMNFHLYKNADPDIVARDIVFRRLMQQRQPMYYSTAQYNDPFNGYVPTNFSARLPGHTGQVKFDLSAAAGAPRMIVIPPDRPFLGMAPGDVPALIPNLTAPYTPLNAGMSEHPMQGLGNTWLSDRYQEGNVHTPFPNNRSDMTEPVAAEANDLFGQMRTLFEVGPSHADGAGLDHPYRRNVLLSKIWNNSTVRSNTFSVWLTIGFFEYDEVLGLGQELNQAIGKNVRHRFFCVVDRTSIDSWLKGQLNIRPDVFNQPAPPVNGIEDLTPANFPGLDPRSQTYLDQTVYCVPGSYAVLVGNVVQLDIPPAPYPNPFVTISGGATPTPMHHYGRLVQVESDTGSEITMLLDPRNNPSVPVAKRVVPAPPAYATTYPNEIPEANRFFVRLTQPHSGTLTIRPVPLPPTVLYWSQYK